MADQIARRMAASDLADAEARLKSSTSYLAEAYTRYAADVEASRQSLVSGEAHRLATYALEIAMLATRVEAARRTMTYLADPDVPKES